MDRIEKLADLPFEGVRYPATALNGHLRCLRSEERAIDDEVRSHAAVGQASADAREGGEDAFAAIGRIITAR